MNKTAFTDGTRSATLRRSKFNLDHSIRAQDFFSGEITRKGQKVSDVYGNYLGFADFDGQRYWDLRDMKTFPVVGEPLDKCLPSDSRLRSDSQALIQGDVENAQKIKDTMEAIQRRDREMREAATKRREKGGPKFAVHKAK